MLDTLFAFSRPQIEQLRYIRVKSIKVLLRTLEANRGQSMIEVSLPEIVGLFPGLQLDMLVVEDGFNHGRLNGSLGNLMTYREVGAFLHSYAWRILELISSRMGFLPEPRKGSFMENCQDCQGCE